MRLNIIPITDSQSGQDAQLQREARDWLILLTSGRATAADARALRQWCEQSPRHARAFEQSKQLWQVLKPAAEQVGHGPKRAEFGRRAFLGGAMAASAALFLIGPKLPGALAGFNADLRTEVGEQRRVELAEGLSLELNTQTRINRHVMDGGVASIELLSGEIEVQASSANQIKVRAGEGWLSAAQARFNLRTQADSVCVTCLEGRLQVYVQGRRIDLQSGRQLVYDAGQVGEPRSVDPSLVSAWRQQLLVFNDTPLATVIDEINRYRPGMLLLLNTELGRRKVQARFRLDQLAGVALLIRDAYGAQCTELPGGVVLLS